MTAFQDGITQYNVIVGSANKAVASVAPSATSGVPVISQGSSANPTFGTVVVAGGGTGVASFTAYSLIAAGTTSTGAMQSVGAGSSGQIIRSGGASALPSWSTATYPATAGTSGNVLTSDGTNWTSAAPASGGLTWSEVTGTSQSMAVNNGYILNNASLVTATLPATAAVGDRVAVVGSGSGGWRIAQNAGDYIIIGSATASTTGVTGHIDSTNRYDCIELICIAANDGWIARSVVGNISIT